MFGIFGHGNVTGLGQALEEVGQDLPYYRPQNEQAMVHAAAAFAKMNNRLKILACTSSVGPGATNMITGAATATVNRIPVLLFPGDTFASRLPHPVLQQLESPVSMDLSVNDAFRPVSRFFDRINRPEQLLTSLPEAMRILLDPVETGARHDRAAAGCSDRGVRLPRGVLRQEGASGRPPPGRAQRTRSGRRDDPQRRTPA